MNKFWEFRAKEKGEGELLLYSEISNTSWYGDEVTPKQFKADLDKLGDIETLNIFINSPGGDVFAGQAIYSILKRHKAKKVVYIDGLAASISSLIAMAGDKIIVPENAMMMIHLPWTFAVGNAKDFRSLADDLDKIGMSMVVVYEGRSALNADEVREIMEAETWLSAEECIEYGLADELEEAKSIAAMLTPEDRNRYKNIPDILILSDSEEKDPEDDEEVSGDNAVARKLLLELEL